MTIVPPATSRNAPSKICFDNNEIRFSSEYFNGAEPKRKIEIEKETRSKYWRGWKVDWMR